MNAEELKFIPWMLRQAITSVERRIGTEDRDILLVSVLNDICAHLDKHLLELEAAETDDQETPEEMDAHLASHDNTNFDHSGRLDRIENRLDVIERKADETRKAYTVHIEREHKDFSVFSDVKPPSQPSEPSAPPLANPWCRPEWIAAARQVHREMQREKQAAAPPVDAVAPAPQAEAKQPAAPQSNAELRKQARQGENRPPESFWSATDDPFQAVPAPARAERHAKLIALIEKWLASDSDYDEETWKKLNARLNPPAVKVEMRVIPPPWENAGWTWITLLAGLHLHGSQGWPCEYFEHRQDAEENGNAWLAVLSDKLGVPLEANWVEDNPKSETPAE